MKKIIFALSGLLLLSIISCSKEEIKPNQHQNDVETMNVEEIDLKENIFIEGSENEQTKSSGFNDLTKPTDSIFDITDPNRDEDEERKVKRK